MKIDIKKLVEEYPNDMELGSKVRELYYKNRETNNSNQLNLFNE